MSLSKAVRHAAYHDNAISAKERVYKGFAEEHAVGHVENTGAFLVADVLEPDCVSDL